MSNPDVPAGYMVEEIDIRTADDQVLAEYNALANEIRAESRPGEPGEPLEETINDIRKMPTTWENWTCLVRDSSGVLIGQYRGGISRTGDNEHILHLRITMLGDHRRLGLGRHGLAAAAVAAEKAGATTLSIRTNSRVPAGGAFAEWAGFAALLVERESELILSDVDWAMVDEWVAQGPVRAPGYTLELVEGAYPENRYDDVIAWWEIMNTAPRDGLDYNDDHLTKDQLAEWEAQFATSETDRWEFVARHVGSGACVGVTNIFLTPWDPDVLFQGDTGVHPDHRGHALGKWLKAKMLQKVRAERSAAKKIRTGNAFSNDAMLGINNSLGFKESRAETAWQAPVEKIKSLFD